MFFFLVVSKTKKFILKPGGEQQIRQKRGLDVYPYKQQTFVHVDQHYRYCNIDKQVGYINKYSKFL